MPLAGPWLSLCPPYRKRGDDTSANATPPSRAVQVWSQVHLSNKTLQTICETQNLMKYKNLQKTSIKVEDCVHSNFKFQVIFFYGRWSVCPFIPNRQEWHGVGCGWSSYWTFMTCTSKLIRNLTGNVGAKKNYYV